MIKKFPDCKHVNDFSESLGYRKFSLSLTSPIRSDAKTWLSRRKREKHGITEKAATAGWVLPFLFYVEDMFFRCKDVRLKWRTRKCRSKTQNCPRDSHVGFRVKQRGLFWRKATWLGGPFLRISICCASDVKCRGERPVNCAVWCFLTGILQSDVSKMLQVISE